MTELSHDTQPVPLSEEAVTAAKRQAELEAIEAAKMLAYAKEVREGMVAEKTNEMLGAWLNKGQDKALKTMLDGRIYTVESMLYPEFVANEAARKELERQIDDQEALKLRLEYVPARYTSRNFEERFSKIQQIDNTIIPELYAQQKDNFNAISQQDRDEMRMTAAAEFRSFIDPRFIEDYNRILGIESIEKKPLTARHTEQRRRQLGGGVVQGLVDIGHKVTTGVITTFTNKAA